MSSRFLTRLRLRMQLWPIRRYRSIDGWLTKSEALGLYRAAQGMPEGARIVEIGSWKGKSTYCLAKGLRKGVIFAVDPFDASGEDGHPYLDAKGDPPLLEQFRSNLGRENLLEKIVIKAGLSSQFANQLSDIDFLFIDGDHSIAGCRYDYETFSSQVKAGGILAFHDYHPERPDLGPTWVVDNLVARSGRWRPVGRRDSLILFRRTA